MYLLNMHTLFRIVDRIPLLTVLYKCTTLYHEQKCAGLSKHYMTDSKSILNLVIKPH